MPKVKAEKIALRRTSKKSVTATTRKSESEKNEPAPIKTMDNTSESSTKNPTSEGAMEMNISEEMKKKPTIFDRTLNQIKKRNKKTNKAKNYIQIQIQEIDRQLKEQNLNASRDKKYEPGVVVLSHIPPGFYEKQMMGYFSQFGDVNRIKLARSAKTGRSRGYAYIEFEHAIVAKIVAETMNNYILFNRLLKAKCIERLKRDHKFWNITTNRPRIVRRNLQIKRHNRILTPAKEETRLRKRLENLNSVIQKLKKKGIEYSYKPAIHRKSTERTFTESPGRFVRLKEPDLTNSESDQENKHDTTGNSQRPVLEIDESDEEIVFNTPPNVVKKKLLTSNPLLLSTFKQAKRLRKVSERGRRKLNSKKRRKRKASVSNFGKAAAGNKKSFKGKEAVKKTVKAIKNRVKAVKNAESKEVKNAESKEVKKEGIKAGKIIRKSRSGKDPNKLTRKLRQKMKKRSGKSKNI